VNNKKIARLTPQPKLMAAGFRGAGFQTCCVADFSVGGTNGSCAGGGLGNPRYGRLGSLRYFGNTNWFSVPVVTNNNVVIENFNILPPD